MPSITSAGVGSGLDINGLVNQLLSAEAAPVSSRLNRLETGYQAEISALGSLKSALADFEASITTLKDGTDFDKMAALSSDDAVFTVSADTTAVPAVYDVDVQQIAKAHQLSSVTFATAQTVVGEGQLTIDQGTDSFSVTIDSSNSTLEGIRDAINGAADNPGVVASIVNTGEGGTDSRLVLTSGGTGSTNELKVTITGDSVGTDVDANGLSQLAYDEDLAIANMTQERNGDDAIIEVSGIPITRSSNTISDAVDGVTFNLKTADPGNLKTASISRDKTAAKGAVNVFVTNFNRLVDTFRSLGDYDAETGAKGTLVGDATLRGVEARVRSVMGQTLGDPLLNVSSLADIGISTDEDGKLELDSAALDDALESYISEFSSLFGDEDEGLAVALGDVLEPYTQVNGILDNRVDGLEDQISDIGDRRDALSLRIDRMESRLLAQFTALDTLVSELTSTSNFLGAQLSSIQNIGASRSSK